LKALKEEIRIMKLVKSEHIVKLYAAYQSKDNYYLILEYCSGGDLDSLVGKRLPETKIQQIISQLAKALKTLIDHSVLHRDLKLSNILISNDVLKLADFGVARTLEHNELANTFCGTPLYMAPEILAGYLFSFSIVNHTISNLIYGLLV
jgi:serine/threonine-protein kinase ULK/ATG1